MVNYRIHIPTPTPHHRDPFRRRVPPMNIFTSPRIHPPPPQPRHKTDALVRVVRVGDENDWVVE